MQSVIRIGSRESRLAVIQAEIIKNQILKASPGTEVQIVTMKTTGDRILDKSLDQIGGKGLFVKELDRALLEGKIDLAVHSLKDMPMETPGELPVLAYAKREDPRDVLVFSEGIQELPKGGVIGTSSRRRKLQLLSLYPGCTCRGIRGNVQTRLKKLKEEAFDATVLAAAGLARLGMEQIAGHYFSVEEMVPAAGQGILAVQGRRGENWDWISRVDHRKSRAAALAERQFVAALDGGCTSPVAAYADINGTELMLTGLYYRESDGQYFKEILTGTADKPQQTGEMLADRMRRKYGK